jgi:ribosome maturation protein Sdo1
MADVQIVKFKSGKTTFVVLTKPGTVLKYRKGLIGSIDNVLMTDDVRTAPTSPVSHRLGPRLTFPF